MSDNIEVTDMYLVAALIAYGADYVGVDRADRKSQKFLFRKPIGINRVYTLKGKHGVFDVDVIDDPSFDEVKLAYDTTSLLFPPNYSEILRRVKGIIHT